MSIPYKIIEPKGKKVPFILSVPHCGTAFPDELKDDFIEEKRSAPDDTDWFVHDLYSFASEMGITIIHAVYSRWVIDLNRDPQSAPLYNDGRIITGLTTTTDFFGNPIYKDGREPNQKEIDRRVEKYYNPYHNKVRELLQERIAEFGKVLLWDAHSIRHHVPTIREDVFPDMILGDNDETTADQKLIDTALKGLSSGEYGVNHNHPFKGGYITRSFGDPKNNVHALQLEMNKILYMDDTETKFDSTRANKIRSILQPTYESLLNTLSTI